MDRRLEILRGICILVSFVMLIGAILIRWFQRTQEDPGVLTNKILMTLSLSVLVYFSIPLFGPFAPFVVVFFGVVFSILWTPSLGTMLVRPITDMIEGESEPAELKPYYSIARGLRAKGRYEQAVAEVEKQLRRFPNDFEGQLLLAEIQVEDFHDLPAAEATVQAICDVPKQSSQHIAAALNTLADWHLKHGKNHVAARRDLERVVELFPGSEAALGAAQRIAHLGSPEEKPWSLREHRKIFVPEGIKNYGLVKETVHISAPEADPEAAAAEYVKHLEQHPQDTEAREQLALIYAGHYQRLDLAANQLEQMIAQPNQPARNVAHWLNLLADLQIRCADDYEAARQALQRIVDRFPNLPTAELAHNRIELLRLELKAKGKSQAVKLGSYEQNIGLKYGPPKRH